MRSWHWNGERWYERNFSIFKRIRIWFLCVGGWERANHTRWEILWRDGQGKLKIKDPTPVGLFGHLIVFYGWGWNVRTRRGWFVKGTEYTYLSPDGTPSGAEAYYFDAPPEVKVAAQGKGEFNR